MTAFGMLVKSHAPDLAYAERLLRSIERHDRDGIDVHVVVPDSDVPVFRRLRRDHVTLLPESDFGRHLVTESRAGLSPGYVNQEIVKLCFWESGLADNYLCVDSDAEFVRDFGVDDFMADENTPYTFLTEDRDLQAEPEYYESTWVHRAPWIARIADEIGLEDSLLRTVHGHAVFSAAVLRGFRDRFLAPRGWDYADALSVAPFEPTWYNFWLQHDRTIPIVSREPIVKTFHDSGQYLDYVLRGITNEDAARGYVAIVLNSNFSRGDGLVSLHDSPAEVLARYVPTRELLTAAGRRFRGRGGRPA